MNFSTQRIYVPIKRALDIAVSAVFLVLLLPVYVVVGTLILITDGRPIFFTQQRPGKNGRIFKLYKFRTMSASTVGDGLTDRDIVQSDEHRLTKLGSFLRKTSLDELPEIFNVLKGDMSFVGPRPLLVEYLELYDKFQMRRHEVRPGITGLAQVSGRNLLDWQERFTLDVEYVDAMSFWLDLKILCKTVAVVFSREGVSAEGAATMLPFTGNDT